MDTFKVLIVEDDEVTALNLKMSLEKHNYNVVSISNTAMQAHNKIKVYHPQIILVDISLQKSDDGIELAHYIREKHQLPFIYLTAHTDSNIINMCISFRKLNPDGV